MMKKLMCLILALVTALSLVPAAAATAATIPIPAMSSSRCLRALWIGLRPSPTVFWCRRADPKGLLPGINKADR